MNARPARHGFSLIEVMVVLAIIVVLLFVLQPLFEQAQRSAWIATCGSNQRQIFTAHQLVAQERHNSPSLRGISGWSWPETLMPYLNDPQVLVCPEDEPAAGGVPLGRIALHTPTRKGYATNIKLADLSKADAILDLSADVQWVRQLSQEQYDDLVAYIGREISGEWFVNKTMTWWQTRYSGYVPGANPDRFYLMIDPDIVTDQLSSWTSNYVDLMMVGERREDGQISLNPMHGVLGSHEIGWLVDEQARDVMSPKGFFETRDSRTHVIGGSRSSYGMNDHMLYEHGGSVNGAGQKIVAIDYEDVIVEPSSWHDWDDALGLPAFARHPSDAVVNALFLDGSIRQVFPQDISPELISTEQTHWLP